MPKILITGNGFDLNENLPTKYSDFLSVINFIVSSHENNFDSIIKNIECYIYLAINYYTDDITIDSKNLEKIKLLAKTNQLFLFFKDEFEIDTWIDFENRIEYLLKNIFEFCTIINKNIFEKSPIGKTTKYYNYLIFDNKIEIAEILTQFGFVHKHNTDTFSLNKNYLNEKFDFYTGINYKKIAEEITHLLDEFSELFNLYIQIFVIPLYNKRKEIPKNLFSHIDRHYTFNYTPTFNLFYGDSLRTSYLHGKSSLIDQNMVLGVDNIDLNIVREPAFLNFTKYYQKYSKRTDYYFLNELGKDDLNENFEFYFWGHSLNRSDADYINEVFDFVTKLKQTIKRIIVVYHSDDSYKSLLLNLFSVRGKVDIENKIKNNVLVFLHCDSVDLKTSLHGSIAKPDIFF